MPDTQNTQQQDTDNKAKYSEYSGLKSSVADATTLLVLTLIPALKGRAKFNRRYAANTKSTLD